MIYDCVLFYNEVEMYDKRLLELQEVVDIFIVVEADKTFTNIQKKALNFNWNSPVVKQYKHKIKYLTCSFNFDNPWKNEEYQRNYARDFLLQIMNDNDFVIFSDLDEIPFANVLKNIKSPARLEMDLYYYSLEWLSSEKWYHAIFVSKKELLAFSIETMRMSLKLPIEKNAGRHLSYFMSPDLIRKKIEAFSHQEFNKKEFKDKIEENLKNGLDPFGRFPLLHQSYQMIEK